MELFFFLFFFKRPFVPVLNKSQDLTSVSHPMSNRIGCSSWTLNSLEDEVAAAE